MLVFIYSKQVLPKFIVLQHILLCQGLKENHHNTLGDCIQDMKTKSLNCGADILCYMTKMVSHVAPACSGIMH